MKPNLRILENGNELINLALSLSNVSIACGIARLKESTAMGGKPTTRCNRQVDTGLTRTQSLLLRSNDNSDSVR
ncbi:MAG: hypothetical protein IPL26_15295 [Leptospiraceae bacterium]|nr:hypothetical protein [Leptospiraceae bacterium]